MFKLASNIGKCRSELSVRETRRLKIVPWLLISSNPSLSLCMQIRLRCRIFSSKNNSLETLINS